MQYFNKRQNHLINIGWIMIISCYLLFISFNFNFFGAVNQRWFTEFQVDSKAVVIGRLIKSSKDGLFSDGGRLGRYVDTEPADFAMHEHQTGMYYGLLKIKGNWTPYLSQIGGAGIFFSTIDIMLNKFNLSGMNKLDILQSINAALLSLTLTLVITVLYAEFGLFAAITVLISILASQWLIVFGRDIFFIFWIMYWPMVAVLLISKYEEKNQSLRWYIVSTIVFILVALKCTAGYEYITSVIIAAMVPSIYFGIKNGWSIGCLLRRIALIFLSSIGGFIFIKILNIVQVSKVDSTPLIQTLIDTFYHDFSRMYFLDQSLNVGNTNWHQAFRAWFNTVLNSYWNGEAFNLNNVLGFNNFDSVAFSDLVLLFLIFSCLGLISANYSPSMEKHRNKVTALIVATWVALLAPLSWYVLAKVHSSVHTHINHVLWHLPFTIFGFALVGFVTSLLMRDLCVTKIAKAIFATLISVFLIIAGYSIYQKNKVFTTTLVENTTHSIYNAKLENGLELSLLDTNKLVFFLPNCRDLDLSISFFVHVFPFDPEEKELNTIYYNLDFKWYHYAIQSPNWLSTWHGSCLAIRDTRNTKIKAIRIGQYFLHYRQFWEKYFLITSAIK